MATVVDQLAATISRRRSGGGDGIFVELGLQLPGEGTVEGDWMDPVVGLKGVRTQVAVLQIQDGHERLELMTFRTPPAGAPTRRPLRTLWVSAVSAFAGDDMDTAVAGLQAGGAELVWRGAL